MVAIQTSVLVGTITGAIRSVSFIPRLLRLQLAVRSSDSANNVAGMNCGIVFLISQTLIVLWLFWFKSCSDYNFPSFSIAAFMFLQGCANFIFLLHFCIAFSELDRYFLLILGNNVIVLIESFPVHLSWGSYYMKIKIKFLYHYAAFILRHGFSTSHSVISVKNCHVVWACMRRNMERSLFWTEMVIPWRDFVNSMQNLFCSLLQSYELYLCPWNHV